MDDNLNEVLKAEKAADQEIISYLEKKIYDMHNLVEIGISISSNLDFDKIVEAILFSCIGQLFIEKIGVVLQENIDSEKYLLYSSKGYDNRTITALNPFGEDSEFIKHMQSNNYPQEMQFIRALPIPEEEMKQIELLEPELIVPMHSKNQLNGILFLGKKYSDEPFTKDEKDFIRNIARFSATAVENSRLYHMATQDRMTRLFVHHYFQERLLEELTRCRRHSIPLSLIMMDIDHFKLFNDTWGHQQGDSVLKSVASIIKSSIRNHDIPARYGGEEFAIILPETKLEDAVSIADRLRVNVDEYNFPGQEEPLHVTVSLGVSQFDPEIDPSKEELIKRVDDALYCAKKGGRNCVKFSPAKCK